MEVGRKVANEKNTQYRNGAWKRRGRICSRIFPRRNLRLPRLIRRILSSRRGWPAQTLSARFYRFFAAPILKKRPATPRAASADSAKIFPGAKQKSASHTILRTKRAIAQLKSGFAPQPTVILFTAMPNFFNCPMRHIVPGLYPDTETDISLHAARAIDARHEEAQCHDAREGDVSRLLSQPRTAKYSSLATIDCCKLQRHFAQDVNHARSMEGQIWGGRRFIYAEPKVSYEVDNSVYKLCALPPPCKVAPAATATKIAKAPQASCRAFLSPCRKVIKQGPR